MLWALIVISNASWGVNTAIGTGFASELACQQAGEVWISTANKLRDKPDVLYRCVRLTERKD